jgi:hypothetical protein
LQRSELIISAAEGILMKKRKLTQPKVISPVKVDLQASERTAAKGTWKKKKPTHRSIISVVKVDFQASELVFSKDEGLKKKKLKQRRRRSPVEMRLRPIYLISGS